MPFGRSCTRGPLGGSRAWLGERPDAVRAEIDRDSEGEPRGLSRLGRSWPFLRDDGEASPAAPAGGVARSGPRMSNRAVDLVVRQLAARAKSEQSAAGAVVR